MGHNSQPLRVASVAALLWLSAMGRITLAQDPLIHPEVQVSREYAPMLWLSPGEPFYPTLPHPFGFDGVDNDGDGATDLADADEVWVGVGGADEDARLARINRAFQARDPEPRIIFSAPRPFNIPTSGEELDVLQLWLYYAADVGVGRHEGDSEHAFIFLSRPSAAANGVLGRRRVRAVVGAGHTGDTANNILAASRDEEGGTLPSRLPQHMPLLVEYGKHATAPDRTMDGRFNYGFDSNVFPQAAWGSRDAFDIDLIEFLQAFRADQSFPRNAADVILEAEALTPPYYAQTWKSFPHSSPIRTFTNTRCGTVSSRSTISSKSTESWRRRRAPVMRPPGMRSRSISPATARAIGRRRPRLRM